MKCQLVNGNNLTFSNQKFTASVLQGYEHEK